MGTNYYVEIHPETMMGVLEGQPSEELHIGKSSGGWVFSLHAIPERGLMNLESWYKFLRKGRKTIRDEYKREITLNELYQVITNRRWNRVGDPSNERYPLDPNGCFRHHETSRSWHGKGTYDMIIGDFC